MALARLTRREDFVKVLAEGRRRTSPNFSIRGRENGGQAARLGLIASRKAAPRAVDRNRCKRLAREIFRGLQLKLPGVDLVVQLRTDLRGTHNDALREELRALFEAVAARVARE